MQGSDDRSTPALFNIFVKEFLARLGGRDEPVSAAEADVAGPWQIEELRYTCYGLYRRGESFARGHRPAAICKDRALALLAAAALPGTGREALFHLQKDPTPEGYALEAGGEVVAHLACFDEKLVDALHVLECVLRSPEALAHILEAAGGLALERAGAILGAQLKE